VLFCFVLLCLRREKGRNLVSLEALGGGGRRALGGKRSSFRMGAKQISYKQGGMRGGVCAQSRGKKGGRHG
jgi:hypothetical protein